MAGSSKVAVIAALVANFLIAILKLAAGLVTGSASMLAEAAHSFSDTGNQILLLIGLKRATRGPSVRHQFGYAKEAFFWPFMVAILLFTVAGAYSFYEGYHKVQHPEELRDPVWAFAVLGIAIVIETGSIYIAFREAVKSARAAGIDTVPQFLEENKDASLLTILVEDGLALAGLVLAALFLGIAVLTGNPVWDGIGSLTIGVLLMGFAAFLAVEVKSLLIGEAMSRREETRLRELLGRRRDVTGVVTVRSMHLGPQDVLLALELDFPDDLSAGELEARVIPSLEADILREFPHVKYLFIESVATPAAHGTARHGA